MRLQHSDGRKSFVIAGSLDKCGTGRRIVSLGCCSVLWRRSGAPRPMKMGTIRSPWRYEAAACCAI